MDSLSTALAELLAQTPQVLDVACMNRQSMVGGILRSAVRMNPPLISPGAAVQNILLIWARQVRIEGHVEGQVDGMSGDGRVGAHAGAGHLAFGVGRDHVCLGVRS